MPMEKKELEAKLLEVLRSVDRQRLPRIEQSIFGNEMAWVIEERSRMFQTVNEMRSADGKPPVSLKDIKCVEDLALGHSDYAVKYARYCAELVLGEQNG